MIPFRFRRLIARMRFNRGRGAAPPCLLVSDEGVTLERYALRGLEVELEPVWSFRWEDVRRIVGFKRDAFAVDLICLSLELPDGSVEIHEQMGGYQALIDQLPHRFPGMNSHSWDAVAFPPFETNVTTMWERLS